MAKDLRPENQNMIDGSDEQVRARSVQDDDWDASREEDESGWGAEIFEELGAPTRADPSGSWLGSAEEVGEQIARWAGCRRVWDQVIPYRHIADEVLDHCPSCTVDTATWDSGLPGSSGIEFLVRTNRGPAFRTEFRKRVLDLYREDQGE